MLRIEGPDAAAPAYPEFVLTPLPARVAARPRGRLALAVSVLLLPVLGVVFILWTQNSGGSSLTGAAAWIPLWVVGAALVVQVAAMVKLAMAWLGG